MRYEKLYSGEHLKEINPRWTYKKWSYRLTFEAKMNFVLRELRKLPKDARILDAGCGQGLLVEHLHRKGYDVTGIDAFYGNDLVKKADIMKSGFADESFDVILCLDVIEHFQFHEQEDLIKELTRLLSKRGKIIWSIPNMAHLSSRFAFMFLGRLIRTAKVEYHPGDRPIWEYYRMLEKHQRVVRRKGLGATIPVLYQLTQLWPHYFSWLYKILSVFTFMPNWCFNVIVIGRKR